MTTRRGNHERLLRNVRLTRKRRGGDDPETQRTILAGLGMIGSLGVLVVVPTLLGLALGRWLDGLSNGGVFWTAACIMAGVAVGSWLAWQKVMKS